MVVSVAVVVVPVPLSVPVPIVVVPSLKVTRPVGLRPFTLAVKVTLTPTTVVVTLVVNVVVVAACAATLKPRLNANMSKVNVVVHR